MKGAATFCLITMVAFGVAASLEQVDINAPCPKTLCTAEYPHLACLIAEANLCDCHCVDTADPCQIFRNTECDAGQKLNCAVTGNVCHCKCDTETSD